MIRPKVTAQPRPEDRIQLGRRRPVQSRSSLPAPGLIMLSGSATR